MGSGSPGLELALISHMARAQSLPLTGVTAILSRGGCNQINRIWQTARAQQIEEGGERERTHKHSPLLILLCLAMIRLQVSLCFSYPERNIMNA